ncbi:MAG TPA: recombinase family protein, partial [Anaerolineae bacterium]|nr:recombinase family protein [Anaerolineae bacterium]
MDTVKVNGQKRAVIVARVSTQRQARQGLSIETQLEKCCEYAERNGFAVVEELQDAISGTVPIAERPAGQQLYKLIDDHAVEAVILYTNDRTARDDYSIEYLLLKDHCYSNGIELHYADSGRDDNTVTGNIVGYIKAQIAAEEKRKIAERTMRNKKQRPSAGDGLARALLGTDTSVLATVKKA